MSSARSNRLAWIVAGVAITGMSLLLGFLLVFATQNSERLEPHFGWLFGVNAAIASALVLVIVAVQMAAQGFDRITDALCAFADLQSLILCSLVRLPGQTEQHQHQRDPGQKIKNRAGDTAALGQNLPDFQNVRDREGQQHQGQKKMVQDVFHRGSPKSQWVFHPSL